MASTNLNPNSNPNPNLNPRGGTRADSAAPTPNSSPPSYYMNGKVFLAAGIILVIIVCFILAFHIYARVFWRRRRPLLSWRRNTASHDAPLTGGLDKAIVDSLPTFRYMMPLLQEGGDVVPKEAGEGIIECSVCLIEFEENDVCRLLPKCNHSFHTKCIDEWLLSNTTCPLCRTSAEPASGDDACHTESSTAFCLPHEHHNILRRSNSSPSDCLLPPQDSSSHIERQGINDHMQRSRSRSPLGAELDGAGLHVRRMLARTCSSLVDVSYDLVGEDMRNNTRSESMLHTERNANMGRGHTHRNPVGEASVRHLHLPNWQRSVSDRSLNARQAVQFPSNVLFWGNHSHVDSHLHTDHWLVGGRSLPHISIDVPRPQDRVLTPRSALNSPSQCLSMGGRPYVVSASSVQRQPSRMNSSKSEEGAIDLAEHVTPRFDGTPSDM